MTASDKALAKVCLLLLTPLFLLGVAIGVLVMVLFL